MRNKRKKASDLTVSERLAAPTPKFFRKIRKAGKIAMGIGAGLGSIALLVAAPPIGLTALGTWLGAIGAFGATAGLTAERVSKLVVDEDALPENQE